MSWSPETYERFAQGRLAPLKDLLDAIQINQPESIVDLGCGSGAAVPHLQEKWPNAHILAIDDNPDMLKALRDRHSHIDVLQQNIWDWCLKDGAQYDLIFSNAALHWISDHQRLIPALLQKLRSGGTLAIQVPNNWEAPGHRAMFNLLEQNNWQNSVEGLVNARPLLSAAEYKEILAQHTASYKIWETTYTHALEGNNAVLNWLKGSTLGVILAALDPHDAATYEHQLKGKLSSAYPRNAAGKTHFDFRRLFILARA